MLQRGSCVPCMCSPFPLPYCALHYAWRGFPPSQSMGHVACVCVTVGLRIHGPSLPVCLHSRMEQCPVLVVSPLQKRCSWYGLFMRSISTFSAVTSRYICAYICVCVCVCLRVSAVCACPLRRQSRTYECCVHENKHRGKLESIRMYVYVNPPMCSRIPWGWVKHVVVPVFGSTGLLLSHFVSFCGDEPGSHPTACSVYYEPNCNPRGCISQPSLR